MEDHVGRQIGNYRLLRQLGHGGFADVYLGEHRYLKNYAALKILRATLSDEQVASFMVEAQMLARLAHPQIVRVLDFLVENGTAVLIMDYASSGTMRQHYSLGTRLPLERTVSYVRHIAMALQYAHNRDVIHRDVKPENMLLGPRQDVLLSDFGISLLAPETDLLSTQNMAGTPSYSAPEQLRGKPSFASDQYSLGVVTYEWLCGTRPFTGNVWDIAQQQLSSPPAPLRTIVPDLPPEVEAVVLRALAKVPQERFASVQAFAHALERAASKHLDVDLDIEAQITSPLGNESKPSYASMRYDTAARVFLTATPSDDTFAIRLRSDLEKHGILVSYDSGTTTQKEEMVRQAIRDVQLVVFIVSSSARSSRIIKEHMRIANMYEQRMVFVWAEGNGLSDVLPVPEQWGKMSVIDVIDAREEAYQRGLEKLIAHLEYATPFIATPTAHALVESQAIPRNPYKGLRAFTTEEAIDFFGRDALVDELLESVEALVIPKDQAEPSARLLTVVGPSGSGKSSVVMAGLLPQLQAGALPDSQNWLYLEPIMPGQYPLESLTLALAHLFPERSMKSLRDDLEDDSARGLHLLSTHLLQGVDSKVVFIIDQFEELFTQTISEEERRCFIELLVTAVTEPRGPVVVLITLRADFSDRPMLYPALYRLIELHHKSVLPMAVQDLRAVIERPALLPDVQLTFDGNLIGDLLFESYGQANVLPLLEFTLDQLFQFREGHSLTLAAYQQIGGVKGALAKQAEDTYLSLPSEEHRRLTKVLFLRLVEPGMNEQVSTRRRAAFSELSFPDAQQTAIIHQVIDTFVTARLLTTNEIVGVTTVEISHEALIRAWVRLSDWLREGSEDAHLQRIINDDAVEWERRGKSKDRLYRGSQLAEARVWAGRNMPSQSEQGFIRASVMQQRRGRVAVTAGLLLLVLVAGWLFQFVQGQLTPPTIVTNTQDAGAGSLRSIIEHATSGSTITFADGVRGLLTLTDGDLDIKQSLTIVGTGRDVLAISGGANGFRVKIEPTAVVSIAGISFKNTSHLTSGFIYNGGQLTLTDTTVSGNSSGDVDTHKGFGGGISNFGVLTINRSLISNNKATRQGGGISNFGMLTLTNTTVSGNNTTASSDSTAGDGGGIYTDTYGPLTLIDSTVSSNTAARNGGGIANGGLFNGGPLTLIKSVVSGNTAAGNGGGISNYGQFTATDSTIANNRASQNGGALFDGGGNIKSTTNLAFCTLYGNSASGDGGAIFQENPTPSTATQLKACIIAGNHAPTHAGITDMLTSNGYNLLQDRANLTFAGSGLLNTDQGVEDSNLANIFSSPIQLHKNGGANETYALLPNAANPALDKVPLDACSVNGIMTDQRGSKRPDGNEHFCDIGAYEAN